MKQIGQEVTSAEKIIKMFSTFPLQDVRQMNKHEQNDWPGWPVRKSGQSLCHSQGFASRAESLLESHL
jgi:hypothetical protein